VISLADFDQAIIKKYHITEHKLRQVIRRVQLMQRPHALTLQDIAVGGYYGTSALLHEVVELDILLERDPWLLRRSQQQARRFLEGHENAHVRAMEAEYRYLQDRIQQLFGVHVSIGDLVQANASKDDLDMLIESDVELPIFEPKPEKVALAAQLLEKLRARGKEV